MCLGLVLWVLVSMIDEFVCMCGGAGFFEDEFVCVGSSWCWVLASMSSACFVMMRSCRVDFGDW